MVKNCYFTIGLVTYIINFLKSQKYIILLDDRPVDLGTAPALHECLQAGLLCNDSHLQEQDGEYGIVGDPTEGALIVAAHKAGLNRQALEQQMPRLDVNYII